MLRFGIPLVLVTVAALAAPAAADNPVLQADVGLNDNFVISLKDASGATVTHLDPGAYTIHVVDHSDIHDFDLTGPGVSMSTGVEQVGSVDWNVTFVDGTYRFQCDPHSSSMRGTFTVGTPPPPTVTLKLAGSVGPGRKIALARTATAGKTVITIRDRTSKDNFHLIGPGLNKKTGVAFTGTVKWTVTLKAGTYTARSDAHKTLKRTLKVS